jgi:GH24 family phage-related lysozyme (muramidase)
VKPTLAQLADALIAVFEGPERLVAFRDSGGVWTIARGHTKNVKQGDTCTHEQSVAWFASDQAPLLAMVAGKPLFAGAAYVSFGYNCGGTALGMVLTGMDTIANPKHTTDRHGVLQNGLVSRRLLERLMIEAATL